MGNSPLDTIFRLRDDLIKHIAVLEGNNSTEEQRDSALQAALTLVCQDLRRFASYRFARLHEVARARYARIFIWRRRILGTKLVQADLDACDRIGRALDDATEHEWNVRESLVDCYKFLLERLEGQKFAPLTEDDLPPNLHQLCDDACNLADMLGKSGKPSDNDRHAAGVIVRKALAVTIMVGSLIGLEQNIVPFSKDVVRVVMLLVHGVDRLVNDDMFVAPVPPSRPQPPDPDEHGGRPPDLPDPPGPNGPSTPPAQIGDDVPLAPSRDVKGASKLDEPPRPKRLLPEIQPSTAVVDRDLGW